MSAAARSYAEGRREIGEIEFLLRRRHSRRDVECHGRDALATLRRAMDWLEDLPEFEEAHQVPTSPGEYVRRTLGWELHREGREYKQRCPVALAHVRVGMSVAYVARERHCLVCGKTRHGRPHIRGRLYTGQLCVSVVTQADLLEVSLVSRPVHLDARIEAMSVPHETLRADLGPTSCFTSEALAKPSRRTSYRCLPRNRWQGAARRTRLHPRVGNMRRATMSRSNGSMSTDPPTPRSTQSTVSSPPKVSDAELTTETGLSRTASQPAKGITQLAEGACWRGVDAGAGGGRSDGFPPRGRDELIWPALRRPDLAHLRPTAGCAGALRRRAGPPPPRRGLVLHGEHSCSSSMS